MGLDTRRTVGFRSSLRRVGAGLGDVVFLPRLAAGILVLAAIAVADLAMVLPVLVGATAATASSVAVARIAEIRIAGAQAGGGSVAGTPVAGAYGYCGALVGAAAYLDFPLGPVALVVAAVGGVLCGPLGAGVAAALGAARLRFGELPVLTAPFCLISGVVTFLAVRSAPQPTAAVHSTSGAQLEPLAAAGQAIFTSISQVLLVNDVIAGLLLLVGLLLVRWRMGLAGLAGSVIAAILGWGAVLLGFSGTQNGTGLQDGLLGYSAVLTAMAVAVVFERPGRRTIPVAIIAAAATVPLAILLSATPIPVFTWPYVVSTWLGLAFLRRSPVWRHGPPAQH